MNDKRIQAYALFNDGVFATIMYYPSIGDDNFVAMTAALKSNPTIVLDTENTIQSVNKYNVFVEDDYAGFLFILKEDERFDLSSLHQSLLNNPTVVWIESDTLPTSNTRYLYENNVLTLIEE